MKTLISEFAMVLMAIVLVAASVFFVKDSVSATVGDVAAGWEERKLNRQIILKLKALSSQGLRSVALNVFLEDVLRLQNWLKTKSILPEEQKRKQLEECHQTFRAQHAHYSAMIRSMQDKDVVKLVMKQVAERNFEWRRSFLNHFDEKSLG